MLSKVLSLLSGSFLHVHWFSISLDKWIRDGWDYMAVYCAVKQNCTWTPFASTIQLDKHQFMWQPTFQGYLYLSDIHHWLIKVWAENLPWWELGPPFFTHSINFSRPSKLVSNASKIWPTKWNIRIHLKVESAP